MRNFIMLQSLAFACVLATVTAQPKILASNLIQCRTDNGTVGICMPYFLCHKNKTMITDGQGSIDPRSQMTLPNRINITSCLRGLELCCPVPNQTISIIPQSGAKIEGYKCGQRNKYGVSSDIKDGMEGQANFGEFPWMVAIFQDLEVDPRASTDDDNSQNTLMYTGGGSLIHPSVVLTAAHTVADASTLKARAGEWSSMSTQEIYPHQDRDVAKVEIHKDFNKNNYRNDIALLILNVSMELAPHVGVACLPPPHETAKGGTRCFASGWGKDSWKAQYQVILKKVELPIVEHSQCEIALQTNRMGPFFQLHRSFMCAGGELGVDTCKGDGGSPLVCSLETAPDRYVQRGIVAWGLNCAFEGVPGVYVDVSTLRDWIDNKVTSNGFDPQVYTY